MANDFSKIKNAQGVIDIAVDILKNTTAVSKAEAHGAIAHLRDESVPFSERFNNANTIWRASVKAQLDDLADKFEQQINGFTDKYHQEYCTPFAILTMANQSCDYGIVERKDAHQIIKYALENKVDFDTARQKTGLGKPDSEVGLCEAVRLVFEENPELAGSFTDESKLKELTDKVYEKLTQKPKNKANFGKKLKKYLLYV